MEIIVYGKKECGKCEAAKDKLQRMDFDYEVKELGHFVNLHEGWRSDGSARILAESTFLDGTLPLLSIDGRFCDYPTAMKLLKAIRTQASVGETSREVALV